MDRRRFIHASALAGLSASLPGALCAAPAGFDPSHRFIEDLRQKDFYTLTTFTEDDACAPDFLDRYLDSCRTAAPLVGFLARAMGLRW